MLISRENLTSIDIAKINRKYTCPPRYYYVGDNIANATTNKLFNRLRLNHYVEYMKDKQ